MVGRTGEDIARIAKDLYNQMLTGTQAPQPVQQQPYQPTYQQPQYQMQQAQQPAGPVAPSEEDWVNNPQVAMQQYAEYLNTTQFRPMLEQQYNTTGSLALGMAQQQHKEAFDKWGPEIVGLYNQLDPQAKANPQNITMIVDMVRGRHVKDMEQAMREQVQKELEEKFAAGGTLRPGTTAAGVPTEGSFTLQDADNQLPPNYARLLRSHNITDQQLEEFLLTNGRDLFPGNTLHEKKKAWLEAAKKDDVITERGFSYNG